MTVPDPTPLPNASAAQPFAAVPTVTSVSPTGGSTAGGTRVTVNGTAFTSATEVRFGAVPATSFTVVSDSQITAVAPPGTGTVQVTVTTPAGTSSQFVVYTYTTTPGPVLSSLTPSAGPAAGGTTVTLAGSGLTGATAVHFGTASATFTVVSDTVISAVAPAGTGTVQVTVTTPAGTSNAVPYTYTSAPVVTAVNPDQGPLSGGNTVTLTGSGFTGTTAVSFGTSAALSFTVVSATQITAVAPPGVAGPVYVTVTTPGGTSAPVTAYFYVVAPVLTAVSPPQGPASGGNTVTVSGSHLIEATAVDFGSTAASSFTVVSDSELTATAPPGAAGPVQLTVSTAGGTSNTITYTYLAGPSLTSLIPNEGPISGGNTVTLTGSGFTTATAVTFGTVLAAFSVVSDSYLTASAPPGAAGPVNVTVTTLGGTSPARTYTRVAPPEI
jgi:hypothetical protein